MQLLKKNVYGQNWERSTLKNLLKKFKRIAYAVDVKACERKTS